MKRKVCLFMLVAMLTAVNYAHAVAMTDSRVLIDFGPADEINGHLTVSPDVNGNYWNNWHPYNGSHPIPNGEVFNGTVIDASNNATGIALTMTNSFDSNGIRNGGLLAPSAELLGDFAVASATEDYWFESIGGAAILISGLNVNSTYDFRMFGTRESTSSRITRYTAAGKYVDLQTSGNGIGTGGYNGNNDTIAVLSDLSPDANGEILLDVSVVEGGYAYLGILEITEVPEPATISMILAGFGFINYRKICK